MVATKSRKYSRASLAEKRSIKASLREWLLLNGWNETKGEGVTRREFEIVTPAGCLGLTFRPGHDIGPIFEFAQGDIIPESLFTDASFYFGERGVSNESLSGFVHIQDTLLPDVLPQISADVSRLVGAVPSQEDQARAEAVRKLREEYREKAAQLSAERERIEALTLQAIRQNYATGGRAAALLVM